MMICVSFGQYASIVSFILLLLLLLLLSLLLLLLLLLLWLLLTFIRDPFINTTVLLPINLTKI